MKIKFPRHAPHKTLSFLTVAMAAWVATAPSASAQVVTFYRDGIGEFIGGTPNQLAVGSAIDNLFFIPPGSFSDVILSPPSEAPLLEAIGNTENRSYAQLKHEYELISPEALASIYNLDVSMANVESAGLERRMEDIHLGLNGTSGTTMTETGPSFSQGLSGISGSDGKDGKFVSAPPAQDNRFGFFFNGIGEFTRIKDTENAQGYDLGTGGFTLGGDYRLSNNFAVGITGGYAHTNAALPNGGDFDADGGKIGVYATAFEGGFYGDVAAIAGYTGYTTHRASLLGIARGDTDGDDLTALVSTGYDWHAGGFTVGPTASFQYTYTEFDSFKETGSVSPLSFPTQNSDSLRSSLGAKASHDFKVFGMRVTPELRTEWQHEFGTVEYPIVSNFANGGGTNFTVHSPNIGRDSLLVGAGFDLQLNERISLSAYYDGDLARADYISNNVTAGVRVEF